MSKYINKKIQEDLSLEEKLQYKKLLSESNLLLKKEKKEYVKLEMYSIP